MIQDGWYEHPPSDNTDIEANLDFLVSLASRVFQSGRPPPAGETGRVYVADSHRSGHRLNPYFRTRKKERKMEVTLTIEERQQFFSSSVGCLEELIRFRELVGGQWSGLWREFCL